MEKKEQKRVLLQTIEIENFKAIKGLKIDFEGKNALISGRNKAGKSTIYEAYLWCLFGKTIDGSSKNIQPRVNNENELGEILHYVKPRVFVTLLVNDVPFVFGRELEEIWNETKDKVISTPCKYYVNSREVPCGEKLFGEHLSMICNANIWTVCSNIFNFIKLDTQKRRALLKDIAECKSDIEIAEDFPIVKEFLTKGLLIENVKKEYKAKYRRAEENFHNIPEQINAQEKLRQKVESERYLLNKKNKLQKSIKDIDNLLQKNSNEELFRDKQAKSTRVIELQTALQRRQNEIQNTFDCKQNKLLSLIDSKQIEIARLNKELAESKAILERYKSETIKLIKEKETLKAEYEKDEAVEVIVSDFCDMCGARLTLDKKTKIVQKKEKEKLQYLKEKYTPKIELNNKLKKINEYDIATTEGKISDSTTKIDVLQKEIVEINKQVVTDFDIAKETANDEKCKQLNTELTTVIEEVNQLNELFNASQDKENEIELKAKKSSLEGQLEQVNKDLTIVEFNKNIDRQKEKLENEMLNCRVAMDEADNTIRSIDEFQRTRVEYLNSCVSSLFTFCKFKMFEENKSNDNKKDICEPYCDGIPINEQNLAMQMTMQIDICEGIMRKIGIELPLFIDNTESINPLPEIQTQKILLQHIPSQDLQIKTIE
jgi:DNA repair protein SbcC/Rad50